MNRLQSRNLPLYALLLSILMLALFATGCATECSEACDGEMALDLCETCAEGPLLEKDCVELYCE